MIADTARPVLEGRLSGLEVRVVSALAMAPIAAAVLLAGRLVFAAIAAVAAIVLVWEWTRMCGEGRFGRTGILLATITLGVVALAVHERVDLALILAMAGAALIYAVAAGLRRSNPSWIAFGSLYIGVPAVALIWLRSDDVAGRYLIVWLFVTVWATDIGAFFAGRLIGGPRLAPRLSPKKTWAGLAGAIVSAAVVGVIAAMVYPEGPKAVSLAAGGAMLAIVAQAGDLGESSVKRRFGAKDSSTLIPGHGGLFDRLDGLMAAGTVLALWQWATGAEILSWQ